MMVVLLGAMGFVFAPCGFIAMLMARRDLKAMARGEMDPSGEKQTRMGRTLAMIASVVWAIKWTILLIVGTVLYLNWDKISN